MWFIAGLILLFAFPPAGAALLLWIGFANKSSSHALNIASRVIGIISLVAILLLAVLIGSIIYGLHNLT